MQEHDKAKREQERLDEARPEPPATL